MWNFWKITKNKCKYFRAKKCLLEIETNKTLFRAISVDQSIFYVISAIFTNTTFAGQ